MQRRIDAELLKWKNSDRRKPLIVRGARQVGKTWSVTKLGSRHFDNTVHMDLEKNRDFHYFYILYPLRHNEPALYLPSLSMERDINKK